MNHAVIRARGKLKEMAGKLTGNDRLRAEGRTDQAKAAAGEAVTDAVQRVRGVRDSLKRGRS
ncbi:CsbD family protein [Streptomyces sp. NPDC055952]|uniref:CsbD family protein n=1 Tax=Streptomyces sp. NPDC055952 TaxID=3345663 RepID=UPI0035D87A2D